MTGGHRCQVKRLSPPASGQDCAVLCCSCRVCVGGGGERYTNCVRIDQDWSGDIHGGTLHSYLDLWTAGSWLATGSKARFHGVTTAWVWTTRERKNRLRKCLASVYRPWLESQPQNDYSLHVALYDNVPGPIHTKACHT